MKKLISKDENQASYLLDNGLTEINYVKLIKGRCIFASYWHPYELRHCFRDFAANSPISYVRLGNKLKAQGLCLKGVKESWNLRQVLGSIADNISMNVKPSWNWHREKDGIHGVEKTIKQAYGSREGFKEYLFKCYL